MSWYNAEDILFLIALPFAIWGLYSGNDASSLVTIVLVSNGFVIMQTRRYIREELRRRERSLSTRLRGFNASAPHRTKTDAGQGGRE